MSFKKRRHRHKNRHGGGFTQAPRPAEQVWIDFSLLPRDLSEEETAQLEADLPKAKRGAKAKEPTSYSELQAMSLAELHEVAEDEGLENVAGRRRDEVIFELAAARLKQGIPVEVEGVIEISRENHAFVRQSDAAYLPAHEDALVLPSLAKQYGLQNGMTIKGRLRPPFGDERHLGVASIERSTSIRPRKPRRARPSRSSSPLYPDQRIMLEGTEENPMEMRIVDLITPIGRGQRGLIVAPPRTGKTILLQMLAKSIVKNAPDAHLIILLIDERPEEVTDFERMIPRATARSSARPSTSPRARHIQVAEMVMKTRALLVEAGEDVVILLDSITRLARACNIEAPSNGKLLSGGIEASALQFPKKFFGAARNIEGGGSLTILGTALIETGSKMDEVIFEEFKGTGNMELVLDRRLSDRRIFPAIDINRSGTRKEELLFTPEEIERVWMLRKVLNEMDPVEAMEMLSRR
jgi:transcription termination factor Rho